MENNEKITLSFDFIHFIKKEYKLIFTTMLILIILLGIIISAMYKTTYQTSVFIKFPQYNYPIDLASAQVIAEQKIFPSLKKSGTNFNNISIETSIIKDTEVVKITLSSTDKNTLGEFKELYVNELMPSMKVLSRERFIYEWQKNNASSNNHLDYRDVESSIIFSDPYVINNSELQFTTIRMNWIKWGATILLLSFMVGGMIGVLHYFYPKSRT